jgi:hypothetical protein
MKYKNTNRHLKTLKSIMGVLGKVAVHGHKQLGRGIVCVQLADLDALNRSGRCDDILVRYVPIGAGCDCPQSQSSLEIFRWLLEQYDPASGFVVAVLDGTSVADVFIAGNQAMNQARPKQFYQS